MAQMQVGRSRLKGVLDDLVQQSKEESDGVMVVDEDVEEGARDLLELTDDGGGGGAFSMARKRARMGRSPPTRRKSGRKRICKEVFSQSPDDSELSDSEESHMPHVMTLFDRRVDLARFQPDTPLYVMCREWMWNSPHRLPIAAMATATTTTTATATTTAAAATTTATNLVGKPLPLPNAFEPPLPLSKDSNGEPIRLDIPEPHPPHTESRQELDKILNQCLSGSMNPDLSQLKAVHLKRWKVIRENWKRSSFLNQNRYSQSINSIAVLFQR